MNQHTTLITGATQGLGLGIALGLAARGRTVLLHGRDRTRLEAVAAQVRAAAPEATVRTCLADLADLDQVHALAARIRESEPRLDALVNNAVAGGGPIRGCGGSAGRDTNCASRSTTSPPTHSPCGLLPLLTDSTPARIVNVASMGQEAIDSRRRHAGAGLRGAARLPPEQARPDHGHLRPGRGTDGTGVTVNALHPAHLMDTSGVRAYGLTPVTTVDEGVRPTVRLFLDPELETTTGRYFDRFTDTRAHEQAYDTEARRRLMVLTRALCGES